MSTSVDKAKAKRHWRRRHKHDSNTNPQQKRLVGLGSVVLGRLQEGTKAGALEAFRLYSGLDEGGEILIHSSRIRVESEGCCCSFYLTEGARLICESTMMCPDGSMIERFELESPEAFLKITPSAVEALYEDLMKDSFWDRVAFKHSRLGKPAYKNIWRERA